MWSLEPAEYFRVVYHGDGGYIAVVGKTPSGKWIVHMDGMILLDPASRPSQRQLAFTTKEEAAEYAHQLWLAQD